MSCARLCWTLSVVGVAMAVAVPSAPGVARFPTRAQASSSAATFVRDVLHLRASRQYATLWSKLHPAQKAFVTKSKFIACENKKDAALGAVLRLVGFTVIRTYPEKILIPGTQQTTQSTGVRYRYTMRSSEERIGPISDDSHAVRVNGRWTWLVTAKDAAAYKAGKCRV